MKYCPYCGTEIVDDYSLFCVECGKELPNQKSDEQEEIISDENHDSYEETEAPISDEQLRAEYEEGYDGYYEDLLPIDDGQVYIGIDKDLIKKIALLAGGVLLVMMLCLLMIYIF